MAQNCSSLSLTASLLTCKRSKEECGWGSWYRMSILRDVHVASKRGRGGWRRWRVPVSHIDLGNSVAPVTEAHMPHVAPKIRCSRANQKKNTIYIVTHYRGKKAIIVAHDRISHPEKNYDRKNGTYRWSYLSRKKR